MYISRLRDVFTRLELEYSPVAVKYHYTQPKGVEQHPGQMAFCQFLREAQGAEKKFYITKENDKCFGKMLTGMEEEPGLNLSGQIGADFGCYRTNAPGARLYHMIPTLKRGAHNYVVFSPISDCDFEPDLVICVAPPEKADIIMRATSYYSGDLWESKSSNVLSCTWLYAYPYISGKVNFCITGLHHGLKRRKIYPSGLHMISIPFAKLHEVVDALEEMPWEQLAMKEDEESMAELAAIFASWQEITPDFFMKE